MKSLSEEVVPLDGVDVDAVGAWVELGSVEAEKPDECVGDGVLSPGALVVLEVGYDQQADGVGAEAACVTVAYLYRRC